MKEKYIAPETTFEIIFEEGMLLEGSVQAGGSDISTGNTSQDPFGSRTQDEGFNDNTFDYGSWDF